LRFVHFYFCFTGGFDEDCGGTWWQTANVEFARHNGICKAAYKRKGQQTPKEIGYLNVPFFFFNTNMFIGFIYFVTN
jgi:hypothetical protein